MENRPDDEKVGELKMYANTIQRRFNETKEQKKKRAEEVADRAKQTKVNVAATREDSMFKNVKLQGGVTSNIATEMKQKAREGQDWHSPMFSIGAGRESTNIPKPKEIRRKSPNERATVNGGNHPNANKTTSGTNSGLLATGSSGAAIDSTNAGRSAPYEYANTGSTGIYDTGATTGLATSSRSGNAYGTGVGSGLASSAQASNTYGTSSAGQYTDSAYNNSGSYGQSSSSGAYDQGYDIAQSGQSSTLPTSQSTSTGAYGQGYDIAQSGRDSTLQSGHHTSTGSIGGNTASGTTNYLGDAGLTSSYTDGPELAPALPRM